MTASKATEQISPWVKTSERMPATWTAVLAAFHSKEGAGFRYLTINDTLEWTGEKWKVHDVDIDYPARVTHWMPLPEPPNE